MDVDFNCQSSFIKEKGDTKYYSLLFYYRADDILRVSKMQTAYHGAGFVYSRSYTGVPITRVFTALRYSDIPREKMSLWLALEILRNVLSIAGEAL